MQAGSTTASLQATMSNSSTGSDPSDQNSGEGEGISVNINSKNGGNAAFVDTNEQVCDKNPTCSQ